MQDVIIVGGGPAGLNAAVVLGRCRRKVIVFDTSQHRNRWSHGLHNYLTRDHIPPRDFIDICQEELEKYGVQRIPKKIINALKNGNTHFVVHDEEGTTYHSKKLLLATGLTDKVPNIEGFKEMYGTSVHHCPYCDGWEAKDKKLGVYARDKDGSELALALKGWSANVTLYTDGKGKLKPEKIKELHANNISIVLLKVAKLAGTEGQIEKVVFKNGDELPCDTLFFVNGFEQQCDVAENFGCEVNRKGVVVTNRFQQTNIPGFYVAGDASRDMHFVVVAAAEGAKAGVMINKELQKEISDKLLAENKEGKKESDA